MKYWFIIFLFFTLTTQAQKAEKWTDWKSIDTNVLQNLFLFHQANGWKALTMTFTKTE
jgi:hypothetical protein